ncbi:MAG: hypothetical protein EDQ89_11505 [Acidobacteria bacterium]|nr:MAG: hypothetical protein EDQ89_11505 [Acidobacteriota bacterium]MCL4287770.1 hypothetical protein [Thermoleophilia bacterium]GIK77946.1 MAG: hypothetical protein BroJett022_16360 [Actinomycetes bacterium]
MTEKSDFDAEQWERIATAPAVAAMYVITAEKGGALRESMAVGKAYSEARESSTGSALVDEIVAGLGPAAPERFSSKEQLRAEAIGIIREAKEELAAKGDEGDVSAYRDFILAVAQRVAEADKSGGVLGIGGERVSARESAAIEEIRAALA